MFNPEIYDLSMLFDISSTSKYVIILVEFREHLDMSTVKNKKPN